MDRHNSYLSKFAGQKQPSYAAGTYRTTRINEQQKNRLNQFLERNIKAKSPTPVVREEKQVKSKTVRDLFQESALSESLKQLDQRLLYLKEKDRPTSPFTRSRTPPPRVQTARSDTERSEDAPTSLRNIIKYVSQNIDPSIPTVQSGSYTTNVVLKTVRKQLEKLDDYFLNLENNAQNIENIDRQAKTRLAEAVLKENELVQREADLQDSEKKAVDEIQEIFEDRQRDLQRKEKILAKNQELFEEKMKLYQKDVVELKKREQKMEEQEMVVLEHFNQNDTLNPIEMENWEDSRNTPGFNTAANLSEIISSDDQAVYEQNKQVLALTIVDEIILRAQQIVVSKERFKLQAMRRECEINSERQAQELSKLEGMRKNLYAKEEALTKRESDLNHKYSLKKDNLKERKIDLDMKEISIAKKNPAAFAPRGSVLEPKELKELQMIRGNLQELETIQTSQQVKEDQLAKKEVELNQKKIQLNATYTNMLERVEAVKQLEERLKIQQEEFEAYKQDQTQLLTKSNTEQAVELTFEENCDEIEDQKPPESIELTFEDNDNKIQFVMDSSDLFEKNQVDSQISFDMNKLLESDKEDESVISLDHLAASGEMSQFTECYRDRAMKKLQEIEDLNQEKKEMSQRLSDIIKDLNFQNIQ